MWVPHRDLARRGKSSEAHNLTRFEVLQALDLGISFIKRRATWHCQLARWVPADSISQQLDLAPGRSEVAGGRLDGDRRTIPIPSLPCVTPSIWASIGSIRRQ